MKNSGYFYVLIAMFAWGTNFIATKLAMGALSPVMVLLTRYILCLMILLFVYRKSERPKIKRGDLKYFIMIGLIGYFGSTIFQFICTDMVSASMSSLISTLSPVGILIFAVILLHEKTNRRQNIGIGIAISGAIAIIGGAGTGNSIIGIIIGIIGMLLWGITCAIIRKSCQSYDGAWVTIYTSIVALVCTIPVAAGDIALNGFDFKAVTAAVIAGTLWQGIICTAGANLWWTKALERMDASFCSMFYPIMPLVSAVLGILLLHETITWSFIIGAVLIIGGTIYAILGELREKRYKKKGCHNDSLLYMFLKSSLFS